MRDQITVNITAVTNILRKLKFFEEEVKLLISDLDKTIASAEIEGWNDSQYHTFKDQFLDTKAMINASLQKVEEEHIPTLKKIIRAAEDF